MIKGVFLDLGWTLFIPRFNDWFIIEKIFEFTTFETLMSLPKDKMTSAFNKAIKYLSDNHLVITEDEEVMQFKRFYNIIAEGLPELGITSKQADEIGESRVFDSSNYIFYENVKETLLKLRERYSLGIISDTWPSADRILRSGGIEKLFDFKTYSCYLNAFKPDKRMYIDALNKMGLPPEQTIFVDDCEPNLDGAAECGINSVLIKAKDEAFVKGQPLSERVLDSGKYPTINKIEELPELINNLVLEGVIVF